MKSIPFTTIEQIPVVIEIRDIIATRDRKTNLTWALTCLHELTQTIELDPQVKTYLQQVSTADVPVVVARKMAQYSHKVARESTDLYHQFIYRAIGHTIATIHVTTHAHGVVIYGLKAYHQQGKTLEELEEIAQSYRKKIS